MGFWDTMKGCRAPTLVPGRHPWDIHKELPELPDADPIQTVNSAIKGARNAVRRILSIFDDEESRKLRKGDIIGICRGVFDHYGVYVDDSSVIHYSSKDSDISSKNRIIETGLDEFMRGDDTLFRLDFPEEYNRPGKIVVSRVSFAPDLSRERSKMEELLREMEEWRRKCAQYKLQTPEATVERARSRLGEDTYGPFSNNCEHFAIWCKTDISESHQVNALLELMRKIRAGEYRRYLMT